MELKDLLVHVNVSKHCPARVEIASRLAKTFGARLTGLFTSAVGDVAFFPVGDTVSEPAQPMRAWWQQIRDQVRAEFDASLRESGVSARWIEVDDDAASLVPYHARYADLAIAGQLDPDELLPRPEYEIPERLALDSGRPVLVIPYAGSFPTLGRRVLVAWNGSAQSARALADAFPFLQRAEHVTILGVNPESFRKSKHDRPGAEIAEYLSHHGITAELREVAAADVSVDDMILSQAYDDGADLIVMGAYGHPRAREIILGGATRGIFKQMTVPLLMSH